MGMEMCFLFFWHDSLVMDLAQPPKTKAFGAAFRHLLSEFQVKLSVGLEDVAYMKTVIFKGKM